MDKEKEPWLTGPPDDDIDSDHLVNRWFYTLEEARWMILNGWMEDVLKKYNRPRRMRPFQTGRSFGEPWIETYLIVNRVAWKMERVISSRPWTTKLFNRLKHFFSNES